MQASDRAWVLRNAALMELGFRSWQRTSGAILPALLLATAACAAGDTHGNTTGEGGIGRR